jgi:4-hydroxybenzoate polyprenyltransferase
MKIGVKSTARRFGKHVKLGVGVSYAMTIILAILATDLASYTDEPIPEGGYTVDIPFIVIIGIYFIMLSVFAAHLVWQLKAFSPKSSETALRVFKSNFWAGLLLALSWWFFGSFE